MKKELLSPVGNKEALIAAINNGCDAVYLAGTYYGARKFAKNFTNEELEEAVRYSHLYGVKVYVTVNTIIYEREIRECLKYIEFLGSIGVDAIIVQDLGLISLVHKYYPEMEIHASTQAHTHNIEQIKLLESLGVKRVVLARELALEEINKLDTKMELEVFVHGALCICYSGECLFSAFMLDRSGNRGECAGLCRCLYNLRENNQTLIKSKYLLSPKELNTTQYIQELKKSKACSFKIEGRMKSPEYVGYVTKLYRKLLDNERYQLTEEEIFNLKSLYNRGFTKGYLFNNTDEEFISLNSSNHLGVPIGEVIAWNKEKIKIKIQVKLTQGDAIRLPNGEGMYVNFLYDVKGNLINKANKNDIVYIDNKVNLEKLGVVSLTINKELMQEIQNVPPKKIKIKAYVKALKNQELRVKYSDGVNEVEEVQAKVLEARSMPITKERIKEIMSKLGNTPFVMDDIVLDVDNDIFIPVGILNGIRRNLVEQLISKRTQVKEFKKIKTEEIKGERAKSKLKISAKVRNEEQLKYLRDKIDYIYVANKDLYEKYQNQKNVYLVLDRVMDKHEEYQKKNLVSGETGSLIYTKNNLVVSDYYLNVVNKAYVYLLNNLGVKRITISPEVRENDLTLLMDGLDSNIEIEVIGYGTLEYMIMKYNLLKDKDLKNKYELEDQNKRKFRIIRDKYTHLMGDKKIDLRARVKELEAMGVNVFRLELLDETKEELETIIRELKILIN